MDSLPGGAEEGQQLLEPDRHDEHGALGADHGLRIRIHQLRYARALGRGAGPALTDLHALADYDTDPIKRTQRPNFYGYIPDAASRRTATFACMTVNSAILLTCKSIAAAYIVVSQQGRLLWLYAASDVGLYVYMGGGGIKGLC